MYCNPDRQYKIISGILSGVAYLHSEGVLHRDLKPENILYNSDSDIVINDFGFSRQVDSDSTRLTQYGNVFGTLKYMAPEQQQDARSVDERADIFSLGKVIEDIVTNGGRYNIPSGDLEYVIHKCTETNPNRRFSSVSVLKDTIDNVYQNIFGMAETGMIEEQLLKLQLGALDDSAAVDLAQRFISYSNNDNLEKLFLNITNSQYMNLENSDLQLTESLIGRLQVYYTSQGWGFGYTDIIGNNCRRLYELSHNVSVRANLLFTLIEVGITHNRWHVMGIASSLLSSAVSSLTECTELADLLSNRRDIHLGKLNISESVLPACLREYY